MENKKKRRWFKFKLGWNSTPLWISESSSAIRKRITDYVKDRMLDPLVKFSRGRMRRLKISKAKGFYLILKRTKRYENRDLQTLGTLYVKRAGKTLFTFKTLELPWKNNEQFVSCIPTGTYDVKKRFSQKYKDHLHVLKVPNRTYILIHAGNFVHNTKGCILVGESLLDINKDGLTDVTNSRKSLDTLFNVMPDNFKLKIK